MKPSALVVGWCRLPRFSPAFSGGLIEAPPPLGREAGGGVVFPRVQRGPH